MTQPLISVIVPIYNVEKTLPMCLTCLAQQTYTNIEVICVDDGSTDGSGRIADDFAARDIRFQVVHQENQKLSAARNTGIERATGEYVAFCDSDDYYHPRQLEILYRMITTYHADVAAAQIKTITQPLTSASFPEVADNDIAVRVYDDPLVGFMYQGDLITNVNVRLYRREMFNDVRFIRGLYFEDVPFAVSVFLRAKRVVAIDTPLYYYYKSPNSIMRSSFSTAKVMSYVQLIRHISEEVAQKRPDQIAAVRKKVLNRRFKMTLNQAVRKQKDKAQRIELFNVIQREFTQLFQEKIISYAGLKPHHRLALYLLVHCRSSHPARWVMTIC